MSILHTSLTHQTLSFSKSLTSQTIPLSLHQPSLLPLKPSTTLIRMGGGPRTFPGGVSKWQWKRMQAKKAKQLLKARLTRERQIYEMRKRAELKAAVSDLERPWDPVEKPPNLFSVSADEQVKVLADRFQKPGGFDLWTERDGPELFLTMEDLPSARFFPKGVVHSVRPYKRIGSGELEEEDEGFGGVKELVDGLKGSTKPGLNARTYNGKLRRKGKGKGSRGNEEVSSELNSDVDRKHRQGGGNGGLRLNDSRENGVDRKQRGQGGNAARGGRNGDDRRNGGLRLNDSREGGVDRGQRGQGRIMRSGGSWDGRRKGLMKSNGKESEVFYMRLREDGSYEFE